MKLPLLSILCCLMSCSTTGMQGAGLLLDIPGHQKEMEAREIRIQQCLAAKPPTCTSTYDPSQRAFIIRYKEPTETGAMTPEEELKR